MIISHIIGGLGNQMFQYAAGRALSLSKGASYSLDTSAFADYSLHQGFELQRVFNCPAQTATAADIRNILGWQSLPVIRRILARPSLSILRRQGLVLEPYFHYWPGINDAPANSYLSGYWQSEKYFQKAAPAIRSDFAFTLPMSQRNAELAEQIRGCNAVSLHVRRGDYVKNPQTNATHGLCPLEYYQAAVQYVIERCSRPSFFIFSDDPAWVRENLKMDFSCRYVDHNQGVESYNDMRLMRLCGHHIIANSSFSWWGAWLNPSPDKIVVAPRRWFANNSDVNDLFPGNWVTL